MSGPTVVADADADADAAADAAADADADADANADAVADAVAVCFAEASANLGTRVLQQSVHGRWMRCWLNRLSLYRCYCYIYILTE